MLARRHFLQSLLWVGGASAAAIPGAAWAADGIAALDLVKHPFICRASILKPSRERRQLIYRIKPSRERRQTVVSHDLLHPLPVS